MVEPDFRCSGWCSGRLPVNRKRRGFLPRGLRKTAAPKGGWSEGLDCEAVLKDFEVDGQVLLGVLANGLQQITHLDYGLVGVVVDGAIGEQFADGAVG